MGAWRWKRFRGVVLLLSLSIPGVSGSSHTVCTCYVTETYAFSVLISGSGTSVARCWLGPVVRFMHLSYCRWMINQVEMQLFPPNCGYFTWTFELFPTNYPNTELLYTVKLISVFQCYICLQPPSAFLSSYLCKCVYMCVYVWMPLLCLLEPSNWRVCIGNYQRMKKKQWCESALLVWG